MNVHLSDRILRNLVRGVTAALFAGGGAMAVLGQTLPVVNALTAGSSRIVNFSARGVVGSDSDPLIAGFVVSGATGKTLLLRAVGPTLENFGVAGALADPTLAVYSNTTLVTSNDDWGATTDVNLLALTAANVGAFPLPNGSRDSALLLAFTRLAAAASTTGAFTAQATGKAGAGGTALLEIYDADATDAARVINLSARARVGQGGLIAGFVIKGTTPMPLLIRGIGPALGSFGVGGALADPQLALFRQGSATPLLQNNNWGGSAQVKTAAAGTGAFVLGDTSKDAALLATLDPGVYTVQLTGVGTATGIGLIEIYDATAAASVVPVIAAQPASLTAAAGANASLTVIAASLTPLNFQWWKDDALVSGATSDTLLLSNLQAAQAGTYRVTVWNNADGIMRGITSAPATVALAPAPTALPPVNTFDLVGFATMGTGTTGGGVLATGDPNYHVLDATVANKAQQLRTWLESTTAMVIDVQVEVDLGALNNVSARPRTNPELVASGLGVINVRSNKTVFSSTGATIRHGTFNISGQNNIIVRNLRFRGLWEFD